MNCQEMKFLELYIIEKLITNILIMNHLSIYDEKEWYERNKERVYKDKYLPLI